MLCLLRLQVRLAACHAVRALLLNCDESFREELLPLLLPQLCFNRWHESDGVRLYSQSTWQQAFKQQGPAWLARCLPQVIIHTLSCDTCLCLLTHCPFFSWLNVLQDQHMQGCPPMYHKQCAVTGTLHHCTTLHHVGQTCTSTLSPFPPATTSATK